MFQPLGTLIPYNPDSLWTRKGSKKYKNFPYSDVGVGPNIHWVSRL